MRRSRGSNVTAVSSAAASSPPADGAANAPLAERLFPNNEWVLLVVIAVECLVFGMSGHNFATSGNAFEITRLGVEIGLLALALTPIIVTGGIDLSVGSMMGLAAIVLGWLSRGVGVPMPLAVAVTLLLGVAGGALNAVLITRLKFPPLIVTLGTLSLFRGIAEGVTGGIQHYSGFPESFLHLGQGYVGGRIPTQLFIFVAAAIATGGGCTARASGARCTPSGIPRRGRATPAFPSRGASARCTSCRDSPRAWRR
jgi:ribose/xylose/arabinose/galactoside ABC-type transport system permease subunit